MKKAKLWIPVVIALILISIFIPVKGITNYARYAFASKKDLVVNLTLINPQIKAITLDSKNKLIMNVEVCNSSGMPIPLAHVVMKTSQDIGELSPKSAWTGKDGSCLITYTPPDFSESEFSKISGNIKISAGILGSTPESSLEISLSKPPVILMLGYLADVSDFDNFKTYLKDKGFDALQFGYDSKKGVVASAQELSKFLSVQKGNYLLQGTQVNRFDIIAHSFGGLAARFYTCSEDYVKDENVRKLIFLSVPQRGSPWALLASNYFKDQGIKDLIPENDLYTKLLPGMINMGLNNTIQTGSIMDQYDEVVNSESASLEEWGIKTETFNVGNNNFSIENLFNGSNLLESANHKKILSNVKVYEKIIEMLYDELPYPNIRK